MVRYEGEKMSKSLGNLVMVHDLLEQYAPDTIRLCLAGHHYRQSWEYRQEELEEMALLADKLRTAMVVEGGSGPALDPLGVQGDWTAAMDLDLDTPRGLELLTRLAEQILTAAQDGQAVRGAQHALRDMAGVLGLRLDREGPEEAVQSGWNRHLQRFVEEGPPAWGR
jgi:L-cysteine:1D-myo-inositol 2-amino-2-deoxy-alpha-D-glucopyranoside ligase